MDYFPDFIVIDADVPFVSYAASIASDNDTNFEDDIYEHAAAQYIDEYHYEFSDGEVVDMDDIDDDDYTGDDTDGEDAGVVAEIVDGHVAWHYSGPHAEDDGGAAPAA